VDDPAPKNPSPCLTARRSASGWLAPNQIGGWGFCNGLGSMAASFSCQNRPSKLTRDSLQSAFISRSSSLPSLGIGERPRARQSLERFDERLLDHVLAVDNRPRHAGAVPMELRSQLLEELLEDLSLRRQCRTPRGRSLPWSLQDSRDGTSFGSPVQRGNARVALEAVGNTGRVARIGQKRYHVFTVLPGRERRAIPFGQERLDREARRRAPALAAW